jgi:hypothetical protein
MAEAREVNPRNEAVFAKTGGTARMHDKTTAISDSRKTLDEDPLPSFIRQTLLNIPIIPHAARSLLIHLLHLLHQVLSYII